MSKTIILCADDFGLNAGVSQGILKLAQINRLSAVSCMVNKPNFKIYAPELLALKNKVQIGMHFNLTDGVFLSNPTHPCFSLKELLIKSHLGLIKASFIIKEFCAQLDEFVTVIGFLPDFIDGHQHVHQFPRIRAAILEIYQQRFKQTNTYIRSTWPMLTVPKYLFKTKILALTGGRTFHRQLIQSNIRHNSYFAGVYDFDPSIDYRALFRNWLDLTVDQTLMMCHPGESCTEDDVHAASRALELEYFLSDDFLKDCKDYNVHLLQG